MKNNIRRLALCGSILAIAAFTLPVQASILEADGLGTNWLGSPTFATYQNPNVVNNPNGAFSAEGNFGSGGTAGFGGLAQGFTNSASGILNNIQITLSGASQTFNVFLYDFGAFSSYTQGGGAAYTPGTDLLSPGLQFTYNGGAGGALNVAQLIFSGIDAITLNPGEEYIFAIEPTAAPVAFWSRGGGSTTGLYGQGYRDAGTTPNSSYGAINGAVREFGLAVTTAVPEPASMTLLGIGALVGTFIVRRKK